MTRAETVRAVARRMAENRSGPAQKLADGLAARGLSRARRRVTRNEIVTGTTAADYVTTRIGQQSFHA